MIDCTLDYKNQSSSLSVLVDTGASDVAFIDQFFAHLQNYPLVPLSTSRTLEVVNDHSATSENITHYVQLSFSVESHFKKKFKLLVTQLGHCSVIFNYS